MQTGLVFMCITNQLRLLKNSLYKCNCINYDSNLVTHSLHYFAGVISRCVDQACIIV